MKQPDIPQIPSENVEDRRLSDKKGKLWLISLILSIVSIVFAVIGAWHGFILGFIALVCAVIALVLIWKEFELTKKMISILVLSICAVVLGFYTFGSGVYSAVQMLRYSAYSISNSYDHYYDHGYDDYFDIDEFNEYWD